MVTSRIGIGAKQSNIDRKSRRSSDYPRSLRGGHIFALTATASRELLFTRRDVRHLYEQRILSTSPASVGSENRRGRINCSGESDCDGAIVISCGAARNEAYAT